MARRLLPWILLVFVAASFLHFAHNAEYLSLYPNLPASWSRTEVYLAWGVTTAFGILGFALYRKGSLRSGLLILALYAVSGFAGLLHYTRAPFHHHTSTMNMTILTEVAAAVLLLMDVCWIAAQPLTRTGRSHGGH